MQPFSWPLSSGTVFGSPLFRSPCYGSDYGCMNCVWVSIATSQWWDSLKAGIWGRPLEGHDHIHGGTRAWRLEQGTSGLVIQRSRWGSLGKRVGYSVGQGSTGSEAPGFLGSGWRNSLHVLWEGPVCEGCLVARWSFQPWKGRRRSVHSSTRPEPFCFPRGGSNYGWKSSCTASSIRILNYYPV